MKPTDLKPTNPDTATPPARWPRRLAFAGLAVALFCAWVWIERSTPVAEDVRELLDGSSEHHGQERSGPATNELVLHLRLERIEYDKLEIERDKAVRVGRLMSGDEAFVDAQLRIGGDELTVGIRIGGSELVDWSGRKWTLLIRAEQNLEALGFSRFRLSAPKTRGYLRDWFLSAVLRREGFACGRKRLVRLSINERDLGIYLLEELAMGGAELDGRPQGAIVGERLAHFLAVTALLNSTDSADPGELPFGDDYEFLATYTAALARVAEGDFLDEVLDELGPHIEKALAKLNEEYPNREFHRKVLKNNRKVIRSLLDPKQSVRAHLASVDETGISLAIGNLLALPIEVIELDLGKNRSATPANGPIGLSGRSAARALELQIVHFPVSDWENSDGQLNKLEIRTRVVGSTKTNRDPVLAKAPLPYAAAMMRPREASFRGFEFLVVDEETHAVTFKRGLCTLDRDLRLPSGWKLKAGPGTTIDLRNKSAIITNSPIEFVGSKAEPVHVKTSDGTGQGICVIDASEASILTHVRISGLRSISRPGWELNGALTLYRSELRATHCNFNDMGSEDALNPVQTNFLLDRCVFEDSGSDAFDADYCTGTVSGCTFLNSADDAIDLSGSSVEVIDLIVDGAGDKGISVGEDTRLRAKNLRLTDCEIGVAAKNRSHVEIAGALLADCRIGLSVYQNNADSGPGTIIASRLEFRDTDERYRVEDESILIVDQKQI